MDVLPSGTYTYTIADSGKITASSTIVVTRSNGSLQIREHASPAEATEVSQRTLDAATFVTHSYTVKTDGAERSSITIDGNNVTLHNQGNKTTITAPHDAPFIVDDFYVAGYFQMPATLHATGGDRLTLASTFFEFKAIDVRVSAANTPRPASVHSDDVGIVLTVEGGTMTLWYDRQTFVLRELDIPAQRISFFLRSYSPAVEKLPGE